VLLYRRLRLSETFVQQLPGIAGPMRAIFHPSDLILYRHNPNHGRKRHNDAERHERL
jgi:hypothetical protein